MGSTRSSMAKTRTVPPPRRTIPQINSERFQEPEDIIPRTSTTNVKNPSSEPHSILTLERAHSPTTTTSSTTTELALSTTFVTEVPNQGSSATRDALVAELSGYLNSLKAPDSVVHMPVHFDAAVDAMVAGSECMAETLLKTTEETDLSRSLAQVAAMDAAIATQEKSDAGNAEKIRNEARRSKGDADRVLNKVQSWREHVSSLSADVEARVARVLNGQVETESGNFLGHDEAAKLAEIDAALAELAHS